MWPHIKGRRINSQAWDENLWLGPFYGSKILCSFIRFLFICKNLRQHLTEKAIPECIVINSVGGKNGRQVDADYKYAYITFNTDKYQKIFSWNIY